MGNFENEYLQLLKWTLTDYHRIEMGEFKPFHNNKNNWKYKLISTLNGMIKSKGLVICKQVNSSQEHRLNGADWPAYSETMVGIKRLNNIESCIRDIVANNVPGDSIETGVWRGGCCIYMRAILKILGDTQRTVWVADSFQGLPKADEEKFPEDKGDKHFEKGELMISLETVQNNFKKYNLLDNQVKFLKGWFKDTLPVAPIQQLSLIRLDGDMYQSTIEGLENLYPKLSVGGYIVIDDWGAVDGCRKAVEYYRNLHGINEEIIPIDWAAVYWKKTKS